MAKIYYIGRFGKIYDEEQIARSFEFLGHQVIRREETDGDWEGFLKDIKRESPDFVLSAKLNVIGGEKLLYEVGKAGIKTASWVFDIFFDSPRAVYVKTRNFFKSQYVFTTDGGNDEDFKNAGIKHYLLRQGVFHEQAVLGEPRDEYKYDVVFVGGMNPWWKYRTDLIQFLNRGYGDRFHWFGSENTHEIRGMKLNDLFASAKVVVGDSVYSPHYWSNRIYETMGRGGFMVHPEIEGLDKEFKPYEHFIPYKFGDFNGLKNIIDYYVSDDEARNKIRLSGFEFCRKNYPYWKRCEQLVKTVCSSPII